MYKKMLVPLDGSKLAEMVLPYATELAGKLDIEMTLFHVCEPAEAQFMCQSYVDHTAELVQKHIRVQTVTSEPKETVEINASGKTVAGNPADEIISYANANDFDFILMATHGRSGVKRWVLGSVADKVLRASSIPIWLIRGTILEKKSQSKDYKKTMLVPLDGSKFAESALIHVETLAKQHNSNLINVVLFRVFEKPFVTADYPKPDWEEHVNAMADFFKQDAEQYLAKVAERLTDAGLNVKTEVFSGRPADAIIKYTNDNQPDLIVMATHGSSSATPWGYGSVADKVLRGASSPIFLVRPS